jgi:hypothetical protein
LPKPVPFAQLASLNVTNRKVVYGGVIVLGLVGLLLLLKPSEPRYKDRPLSYWANLYSDSFYQYQNRTNRVTVTNSVRQDFPAAVRQSGAKGVRYFLDELRWSPPWWRPWVTRLGITWKVLQADPTEERRHLLRAEGGFRILRTNALSALPELTQLLNDPRYSGRVANVLPYLGDAAFPAVAHALVSSNLVVQLEVMSHLNEFRGHPEVLAPVLLRLSQSTNIKVNQAAINLFCSCGVRAEQAVPLLVAAAKDPTESSRQEAMSALMCYGEEAVAALPALKAIRQDASPNIRNTAENTISVIERKAKEKR